MTPDETLQLPPITVAVIGSGVVGTATGLGLTANGHRVVFCDIDPGRVHLLRAQGFHAMRCADLPLEESGPDAYFISVPSPTVLGRADLSHVRDAAGAVGRALAAHPGHPVVVVRSTVPPGTTEDVVIPVLERTSGRRAGIDFGVCMSPEFLRAASANDDFLNPRVIVIGALDAASEAALRRIFAPWADVPVVATTLRTAEAAKYVANLFNATKISFFNEMHRTLLAVGADPDAAAGAATLGAEGLWNPKYGTRGGAPFGGTCLPKDTEGFLGFLEEAGLEHLAPVLRATVRTNDEMAGWTAPAAATIPFPAPPMPPFGADGHGANGNGNGALARRMAAKRTASEDPERAVM